MATKYAAFLRAVNVGGTAKLPMQSLRDICNELSLENVQTYIASGNVVFSSRKSRTATRKALKEQLQSFVGKPVEIYLLTEDELRSLLSANPFVDKDPKKTTVTLLNESLPDDALDKAKGHANEVLHADHCSLYVYYPDGQGRSRLKVPGTELGTARNINTYSKVLSMLA